MQAVILTGRIKDAPPVSTMLIAEPERGKTSVALENGCENVMAVTDVTGRGLKFICDMSPKLTHIVINDMAAVMSHGQKTKEYFFAMLLAMLEEGVGAMATPEGITRVTAGSGRRAIIGCITSSQAKDNRHWWYKRGVARRMLPFHFDYPEPLVLHIKAAINSDRAPSFNVVSLRVPEAHTSVDIPAREAKEIFALSERKAKEFGQLGISLLKHLRTLARGHALLRTWKRPSVKDADIAFLRRIDPYLDWKRASLL